VGVLIIECGGMQVGGGLLEIKRESVGRLLEKEHACMVSAKLQDMFLFRKSPNIGQALLPDPKASMFKSSLTFRFHLQDAFVVLRRLRKKIFCFQHCRTSI
jgi:hypothetical protein